MKVQEKTLGEKNFNEMEINDLSDKEFRVMVIKMFKELRRMDKYSENFSKRIKKIKDSTK